MRIISLATALVLGLSLPAAAQDRALNLLKEQLYEFHVALHDFAS